MREKNNFYSKMDEEKEDETWEERIKQDVSRIETFIHREIKKGTQTERNIRNYFKKRNRRKQEKHDEWMEDLDQVSFAFIVIELIFLTYFILALIGIVPMF